MVSAGRAVGEQMQSAARPAGGDTSPVTAGGPPSVPEPSTAPSGAEAAAQPPLDIERLADQVYTIIERRLRFEQESLGL